jgi:hypothetical protein
MHLPNSSSIDETPEWEGGIIDPAVTSWSDGKAEKTQEFDFNQRIGISAMDGDHFNALSARKCV